MTEPTILELPDRPYVGIRGTVTMSTIPAMADRIPEVFGWLAARGIEPAGAPFLKYNVVDMAGDGELEMEAGVPVAATVPGEGEVISGVLPAGRYATVTHVGHFDGLRDTTGALLKWAADRGLEWDMSGRRLGCRLEAYRTNPAEEPDVSKWETDLQFLLAN